MAPLTSPELLPWLHTTCTLCYLIFFFEYVLWSLLQVENQYHLP